MSVETHVWDHTGVADMSIHAADPVIETGIPEITDHERGHPVTSQELILFSFTNRDTTIHHVEDIAPDIEPLIPIVGGVTSN
jgi:hypothetical protein